jgi:hypothetical protein
MATSYRNGGPGDDPKTVNRNLGSGVVKNSNGTVSDTKDVSVGKTQPMSGGTKSPKVPLGVKKWESGAQVVGGWEMEKDGKKYFMANPSAPLDFRITAEKEYQGRRSLD